ncbi:hypothetical protein ACQJBY_015489 [Aegilops geniculata]
MSNHRVCEHRTPPSAMADGGQAPRAPLPEPVFVCAPGTARRPTSPSARLVVPSSPGSTLAVTLTVASLIPCTSPHASVHAPTVPCSACLPCCCSSTSAAPQPRARPCSCRPSSVHWPLSAPASRSTAPGTRTLATTGRAPAVPWPHPAAPIIVRCTHNCYFSPLPVVLNCLCRCSLLLFITLIYLLIVVTAASCLGRCYAALLLVLLLPTTTSCCCYWPWPRPCPSVLCGVCAAYVCSVCGRPFASLGANP